MKNFDNWTRTQKEYFYAFGTIFAQTLLGFMVPPLALFCWAVASICFILTITVVISNYKNGTIAAEKADMKTVKISVDKL